MVAVPAIESESRRTAPSIIIVALVLTVIAIEIIPRIAASVVVVDASSVVITILVAVPITIFFGHSLPYPWVSLCRAGLTQWVASAGYSSSCHLHAAGSCTAASKES